MAGNPLTAQYPFINILLGFVAIFAGIARGATHQSIQDEGNACHEMATAIPRLRYLTREYFGFNRTWNC